MLAAISVHAIVPAAAAASTAYGVTPANELVRFETGAPSAIAATVPIAGLQAGESILGIDVRPATGQLYAVGSTGRLYVINPLTGAATQVGTGNFSTVLTGSRFGVDFNPAVDRIRVVSDTGRNLRLHPDTGVLVAVDTSLSAGRVVASAYTSNHAGTALTTLYGIDSQADQLVLQGGVNGAPSPNGGAITPVGGLGVDTDDDASFDVTANDGRAFAALTVAGSTGLYRIDLATGAATLIGPIGTGATPLNGLAVLSRATTLYGVTTGNRLVRFQSASPGTLIASTPITGLQAGENVLGIDVRPANGELYAIGSTSRLYRVDAATGQARAVGTNPFAPLLSGAEFGVDFNPAADRLRVVSDTGQNLRLNADTGAALVDTRINPAGPAVAGSAYTNNADGVTATTLFGLDANADTLVRQGGVNGTPSPNGGLVTTVGALGVDTSTTLGMDISTLDGTAFAALTVGGTARLYTIDLVSGSAIEIGAIADGTPLRGLAARPSTVYMSEGSSGTFFDTDLLAANPNTTAAPITITFLTGSGRVVTSSRTLAPQSRTTIRADDVGGLGGTAFSSSVTSHLGLPLAVERTMRWDATGYGMHTESAAPALARKWYFAEGAQGFFDTFFLLVNSAPVANTATLEFLLESGATVTRTVPLAPQTRVTVYAGSIPGLLNQSFGTVVTFAVAGAAERAMYFGMPVFNAGHESRGVTQPATEWFLAEGATGSYFTTFLLFANPGDVAANVSLTYFREGGGIVTRVRTIAPRSRLTVNLALEAPSLTATSVATGVVSDVPIVVERAQYWPFEASRWHEAHNSFGVTGTSPRWAFAEGRVGGAEQFQTFYLLANPGSTAASVTMTFLRASGAPIVKTFRVPAVGRLTVPTGPGSIVPELADESFGALVVSDQPIFAERALYSNTNGVLWAAGSNATATAMPNP